MITIKDITEVSWEPKGFQYINANRNLSTQTSTAEDFFSLPILQDISDISIHNNTLLYLTKPIYIHEKVTDTESVSGVDKGFPIKKYINRYYNNLKDDNYIPLVEIEESVVPSFGSSQYLFLCPLESSILSSDFFFNILELKTNETDWNEHLTENTGRLYNNLFYGNDCLYNHGPLEISFISNKYNINLPEDTQTYFVWKSTTTNINDSNFIIQGAIGGNKPENSDVIWLNNKGYDCENIPVSLETKNGQFLCSWLSASEGFYNEIEYAWVDRWFDPDTVTQGDSYINPVNALNPSPNKGKDILYWDIPSELNLINNGSYIYERMGNTKNQNHVDSLSSLKVFELSSDTLSTFDATRNSQLLNYNNSMEDGIFSGNGYLEIQDPDILNNLNSFTFSLFITKDSWCCGKGTQLIGNLYKGGKGIFFNTGRSTPIISFATEDGKIYGMNEEIFKIFEKDLTEFSFSSPNITDTKIDLNGNRWFLDNTNHVIYKMDIDNTLLEKIILSDISFVSSMAINNNNELYIVDTGIRKIQGFDTFGNLIYNENSLDKKKTYIYFDLNNNMVVNSSYKTLVNKTNDTFSVYGSSIYKNDVKWYPTGYRIHDILIDKKDRLWILDDSNIVKIVDVDGLLFKEITLDNLYKYETDKSFVGIVSYNYETGCDEDRIWIINNCNNILQEFNYEGKLLNNHDLNKILNFDNQKITNKGDLSGYDINRRNNIVNGEYISSFNPTITGKLAIRNTCGTESYITVHYETCKLDKEEYHISLSHDHDNKNLRLYINGEMVDRKTIDGNYLVFNYVTTPWLIGGTSGKLGSENEERGLPDVFFQGQMDNVYVFDSSLNQWEILSLCNEKAKVFEELNVYYNGDYKTYIETLEKHHLFKFPGMKSQKFNIVIRNSGIVDSDLMFYVEQLIQNQIKDIKPANTELNSIIWK